MWTKPALARAIRSQSLAHRRRSFTFTPAPLPRSAEPAQADNKPAQTPPRRAIQTQVVLSD